MKYHYRRGHHKRFTRPGSRFGGRVRQHVDHIAATSGLYKSRRGIFMGVCRGLAEHFHLSVFWTRVIVFALFLFTGFWPVGVMYIVAGLLLRPAPVIPLETETDQEFYNSYTSSRSSAIQRIKRKFENIDRRIQRMEHTVTSREFDY